MLPQICTVYRSSGNSLRAAAQQFFALYHPIDKRPPEWPIAIVDGEMMRSSFHSVRVYYTIGDDPTDALKCIRERQPVNMQMQLDQMMLHMLYDAYGYMDSGYISLFKADPSRLPPNVALYMHCPVNPIANAKTYGAGGSVYTLQRVHVLNVIGFGFDSVEQPDFLYFSESWPARKPILLAKLRMIFIYAFQCAQDLGLSEIALCALGAGWFGSLYMDGADGYRAVYMDALRQALDTCLPRVRLSLLDASSNQEYANEIQLICAHRQEDLSYAPRGRVPATFNQGDANTVLFLNAWDPHSNAGNGNGGDPSLDGYFGRHSAMAYISCARLNIRLTTPDCLVAVDPQLSPGQVSPVVTSVAPSVAPVVPTSTTVADFPSGLFRFPEKTTEAIPGQEADRVALKSHELTDEILTPLWVRYMLDNHKTEVSALSTEDGRMWLSVVSYDGTVVSLRICLDTAYLAVAFRLNENELTPDVVDPLDGSLLSLVRAQIFNEIRRVALTRFGPRQQFDPAELFGIKRHLEANHTGGGSGFDDAYPVEYNGELYLIWYNPTVSAINLQHANEFYSSKQEHKIGVSFRATGDGLAIGEIREENKTVAEIKDAYKRVFDAAANQIAQTQRTNNALRPNGVIYCDLCWTYRNLDVIFETVSLFCGRGNTKSSDMQVRFIPNELQSAMFTEDAIDIGGLSRQFVTMIMARATDPSCTLVHREDRHFTSKADELDDGEKKVYSGIGHMLALMMRSDANHQKVVLGTVFDLTFYKLLFHNMRHSFNEAGAPKPFDESEFAQDTALELVRSDSSEMVQYLCMLLDASYTTVSDVTDPGVQYALYESVHYEDDTVFPDDEFPADWKGFWTEDRWTRACAAIRSTFLNNNLRRIAVLKHISRAFNGAFQSPNTVLARFGLTDPEAFRLDLWPHAVRPNAYRMYTDPERTVMAEFPTLQESQAMCVQAAMVLSYIKGGPATVRSLTDKNGVGWTRGLGYSDGRDVRYIRKGESGVENVFYIRFMTASDYDDTLNLVFESMMHVLQGRLSVDVLISSMQGDSAAGIVLMKEFLRTSTPESVEKLVVMLSGSTTLMPSQHIRVDTSHDANFHFHSCFVQVHVPSNIDTYDQATFNSTLGTLIS